MHRFLMLQKWQAKNVNVEEGNSFVYMTGSKIHKITVFQRRKEV
jgi:hypothetical protein